MNEITSYFKREKYIKWRLSLLSLAGLSLLTPLVLASWRGRVPVSVLICAVAAWICFIGFAVIATVRKARKKFPKPSAVDNTPLDEPTRKKLKRRIKTLEIFAVIYVAALAYTPFQIGKYAWLPLIFCAVMYLLVLVALIKAIIRLKKKLKAADAEVNSL